MNAKIVFKNWLITEPNYSFEAWKKTKTEKYILYVLLLGHTVRFCIKKINKMEKKILTSVAFEELDKGLGVVKET